MVYFVEAGPGAPDLITVRGRSLIAKADVIIYAGQLVSEALLQFAKADCKTFNSALMTPEDVIEVMQDYRSTCIVRLHSGDPSIYGAIGEQTEALCKLGIEYEVVPGVSSFKAAAAIKKEFTLPGLSQTIILTRMEGRTPVPSREELSALASHRASMGIFLSVRNIDAAAAELLKGYCDETTPVAVVYKASQDDEKTIPGTLGDIEQKVKNANITKTAQILVGGFIAGSGNRSKLYSPDFPHSFRKAKNK